VRQLLGEFVGTFLRNRGAAAGLSVLALVGLAAATADLLFPYSPWDMRGGPFMHPGEMDFLLGSDSLGRDVAAGIA
jgi:peptide/nickel transport system permease protein